MTLELNHPPQGCTLQISPCPTARERNTIVSAGNSLSYGYKEHFLFDDRANASHSTQHINYSFYIFISRIMKRDITLSSKSVLLALRNSAMLFVFALTTLNVSGQSIDKLLSYSDLSELGGLEHIEKLRAEAETIKSSDANHIIKPIISSKVDLILDQGISIWQVSDEDLETVKELNFTPTPDREHQLLIVVSGSGATNWSPPFVASPNKLIPSFVAWDFSAFTEVSLIGNNGMVGALYAPQTNVTNESTQIHHGKLMVRHISSDDNFVQTDFTKPLASTGKKTTKTDKIRNLKSNTYTCEAPVDDSYSVISSETL